MRKKPNAKNNADTDKEEPALTGDSDWNAGLASPWCTTAHCEFTYKVLTIDRNVNDEKKER